MVDTAITLYNWRHRYLVDETSLQNMQTALVDLPRGTFEGLTGAAVLKGFEASLPGGLQVAAASGIAVAASGYLDAVGTSTTLTLTAPASGTQKCLIVVSPNPTPQNPIPDPMNANSTWNLQTLQAAVVKVITGVASNSAPAYPSKGDNDTILFGVRLVAGQVALASTDIDYNVRETIGKNSQINQNVNRHDDRLRPYTGGLATGLLGIKPSQLPAPNPPCFSHVVQGQPSIFPKASGGAYNGDAGDTFLNFKTGAITGADQSTSAFTPTVPTAGNSIVASVGITASDTLVVAYGVQGTRAQCLAGIKNQQTTGAGAVTILTQAKLLAFVVVTSSDGTNATELDYVDARGTGTLDSSSTLPTAEMVQASATILATTGSTTSGSPSVTSVPLSQSTTGSTISGSRLVSTLGSMAGVFVGAAVTGSGIPAGTLVQAVGGSTAVLSQAATATASGVALTFSFIVPTGAAVSGTGIPASTYVSASSGTTVTLSQNATATASGVALTFSHTVATAADAQAQLDQLDSELNAVELGLRSISPKITTATLVEQATPSSNPAAGLLYLYSKNGDVLATKNSAGTESIVGSGSGQKNYLQASSNTNAGWTAFGNVAVSTETSAPNLPRAQTTQTGWKLLPSGAAAGNPTISIAVAAVITLAGHGLKTGMIVFFTTAGTLPANVVAGTAYYVTVIDANTFKISTTMANCIAGTFVSTFGNSQAGTHSLYFGGGLLRFTLDAADYSRRLGLQQAQNILSGATGDWEIDVYSNTASDFSGTYTRLNLSTDVTTTLTTAVPNLEGLFALLFDAPLSTAPYIEIRWNKLANNTHALVGSDLIAGPGTTVQSAALLSDWQSYTPTFSSSLGTATNVALYWRREGSSIRIYGGFTTGTVGAGTATVSLPGGLTVNTGITTVQSPIGRWERGNATASTRKTGVLLTSAANATTVSFGSDDYTAAFSPYTVQQGSSLFASSEYVVLDALMPINEWAGSGTVNVVQNEVQYAASTTGTWDAAAAAGNSVYGPNGAPISGSLTATRSKVVQLQYPLQQGQEVRLQYRIAGTNIWVDQASSQTPSLVMAATQFGGSVSASGAGATQVTVQFAQFATAGTTWNSTTGAGNYSSALYDAWRVAVGLPGQTVGFGAADANNSGLVTATTQTFGGDKTLKGLTTIGDVAAVKTHVVNGRFQFYVKVDSTSTGTQSNYDSANAGVLYFSNATGKTLTGIIAPASDGTAIYIFNSGGTLNINHQDAGSSSANQIDTGTGVNIAIGGTGGVMLIYINGFWRVFANAVSANTY